MNLTAIEDAIFDWVVDATGLDEQNVIWEQQRGPRPVGTYVTLRLLTLAPNGQDWVEVEDAPSPTPGNEVRYLQRGTRTLTISIQCYGGGGASALGARSPLAIIEYIVGSCRLPSKHEVLHEAGVGIAGHGPVNSIDGVLGGALFEPRARVDVRAHLATELYETDTYIEFAELERLATGESVYVPEDPT